MRSIKSAEKNKYKKFHCKKCLSKLTNKKYKLKENEILDLLHSYGCSLVSKYEDYKNFKSKIKIKGVCGHEYETSLASIINSKRLCPTCSHADNCGDKTYNWNGGASSESERFRKTYEFKDFTWRVYKRDGRKCQICGAKKKLNAHHLDGYNWCVEKRTNVDNGITLCEGCHSEFHKLYGYGDNTKEQFENYRKIKRN